VIQWLPALLVLLMKQNSRFTPNTIKTLPLLCKAHPAGTVPTYFLQWLEVFLPHLSTPDSTAGNAAQHFAISPLRDFLLRHSQCTGILGIPEHIASSHQRTHTHTHTHAKDSLPPTNHITHTQQVAQLPSNKPHNLCHTHTPGKSSPPDGVIHRL
jgi:hypothetical protein